ncbi:hypothetical protein ElyMa_003053600 [Elysia marginata]|uniref:Uncharacterized protein n=1 Tax=Elysia marginata TaxID=1093978 RepID=A0AAV4IME7_9GAST|nr:hypothetical protein ElyMa_003053600 [Elysia marginata]
MDAISKLLGNTDVTASVSSSISNGGSTTRRSNISTTSSSRYGRGASNYGNNRPRPWARQPAAANVKVKKPVALAAMGR